MANRASHTINSRFSKFKKLEAWPGFNIPAVTLKVELGKKRAWRQRPRHIFQIAHPTFWLIQEAPGALVAKLKIKVENVQYNEIYSVKTY